LDQVLAARYSPPGVLINEKMEILRFHGATGAYLRPAPGEPQNNIIKMLRGGLVVELRAAMARAKKQMAPVRSEGIEVDQDGSSKTCDLVVLPLTGLHGPQEPVFVVLFEEAVSSGGKGGRKTASGPNTPQAVKLAQKLAATGIPRSLTETRQDERRSQLGQ
jgi:two-component system CheB/CheR fusion protein